MKDHSLNFFNQTFELSSGRLDCIGFDISTASIEELSAKIVEDMIDVVKKDLASINEESKE